MPSLAPPRHRSTHQAKANAAHEWYVADVAGKTLGRAATRIASVLRGKHKATFTRHADTGDFVVVVNAEKIRLSGRKWTDKIYYDHSMFPGGTRAQSAEQLLARHPTALVERAVWGMLPGGPLGRRIASKLKVYAGPAHPHVAQQPRPLELA